MNNLFKKLLDEVIAESAGSGLKFADSRRYDPYKAFMFEVEISGNMTFARAGFQKVSGLKMTTDAIEYREGGDPTTVTKTPGLTKFEPITLERGMSDDMDMWSWACKIFSMDGGTVPDTNARANVTIKLKDRAGAIAKKWEIPEAWVSEYNTGDLDAQGNNVLIEKITLQHQGFRQVSVS